MKTIKEDLSHGWTAQLFSFDNGREQLVIYNGDIQHRIQDASVKRLREIFNKHPAPEGK